MTIPQKTGLYLKPTTIPIVERVMEENKITTVSGAINFVLEEYNNKVFKKQDEEQHALTEEEIRASINAWFVAEEGENGAV